MSTQDSEQYVDVPLMEVCPFLPCSTLSLIALHGMNIPMYGAIKRCTPLVNLVLSVMVLRKPFPSVLLTFSIGLITIGVLIAGLGDLTFDGHAYTMGTLSVFAQVGYIRPTLIHNILFLNVGLGS